MLSTYISAEDNAGDEFEWSLQECNKINKVKQVFYITFGGNPGLSMALFYGLYHYI